MPKQTKTKRKPAAKQDKVSLFHTKAALTSKPLKRSLGSTPLLDIFLGASSAIAATGVDLITIFGHRSLTLLNGLTDSQAAELTKLHQDVCTLAEDARQEHLLSWLLKSSLPLFQLRIRHDPDPFLITSTHLDGVYSALAATNPMIAGPSNLPGNEALLRDLTEAIMRHEPKTALGQHVNARLNKKTSTFTYNILNQLVFHLSDSPLILKSSTPHSCSMLLTHPEQSSSPMTFTLGALRDLLALHHGILAHIGASSTTLYYPIYISDHLLAEFALAQDRLLQTIIKKLITYQPETVLSPTIERMPGDGNCAFHAMHYAVTGIRLDATSVYALRLQIASALYDGSDMLARLKEWLDVGYTVGAITAFLCEPNCWQGCIAEDIISLLSTYYSVSVTVQQLNSTYEYDATPDQSKKVVLFYSTISDGEGHTSHHYDVVQCLKIFDLQRTVRSLDNTNNVAKLLRNCTSHDKACFRTYNVAELRSATATTSSAPASATMEDDLSDLSSTTTLLAHRTKRKKDDTSANSPHRTATDTFFTGINPTTAAPMDRIAATILPTFDSDQLIVSDLPIAAMADSPGLLVSLLTSALQAWQLITVADLTDPLTFDWIYHDTMRRFGSVRVKLPTTRQSSHHGDRAQRIFPGIFNWTSTPYFAHAAERRNYLKQKITYRLHGRLANPSSVRGFNLGRIFVVRGLSPHCNVLTMQLRALHHYLLIMIRGYRFDTHPHTIFRPDGVSGSGPLQDLVCSVYLYGDEMHSVTAFLNDLYTNMGFGKMGVVVDVPIFGMSYHFYKDESAFPINYGERPIFHCSMNVMHLTGFPRRSPIELITFLQNSTLQLQDLEVALQLHGDSDRATSSTDVHTDELVLIWRNRSGPLLDTEWIALQSYGLQSVIQYKNPKNPLSDYVPYRPVAGDQKTRKTVPPSDPSWQLVPSKQQRKPSGSLVHRGPILNINDSMMTQISTVISSEVDKALTSNKAFREIRTELSLVQKATEESSARLARLDEGYQLLTAQNQQTTLFLDRLLDKLTKAKISDDDDDV